jgi:tRNA threonylcarbamoyl adenosine modification protein (Sua5/YciO/YrdC/YwlC family)
MATVLSVNAKDLKSCTIQHAAQVLRQGGIIIYPTDTIYGLGCDITNPAAIERIRHIKGRDPKKPMSFICAHLNQVCQYAHVTDFAYRILKHVLPGAYTFVLPATTATPQILQSNQHTVGLRIPDHRITQALVENLGNPIISTSANRSNEAVLTDPCQLETTFGNEVDLIIESGALPIYPSSVISLLDDKIEILREGQGDLNVFKEVD